MIRIENLSKKWDEFEICNINLEVRDREYFVILGPSGAGKTLLLELIAGFCYPDSGSVFIDGREITFEPPEKRKIGFMYQDYLLFPHKNVYENISYGLKLRNVDENIIADKVHRISALLGIDNLLHRMPETLSGGEKQRVALARALIINPKVMLLDEPLNALDPQIQIAVRAELKRIHKDFGFTTIHVTHDREEAFVLADRIAVLNQGYIVQIGTPEEIFRKPRNHFMADFVGVENIFSGIATHFGDGVVVKVNKLNFRTISNKIGEVKVAIRPEDIIISKKPVESSARNVLKGKVKELLDRGAVVQVVADCGIELSALVTRQSFLDMNIGLGSEIYLVIKAHNVHLF